MTDNFISHIESFLGEIDRGWKSKKENKNAVVRFKNQPVEGLSTYVTLGFNEQLLHMPDNRKVRQELVFTAFSDISGEEISSLLLSLGNFVCNKGQAILRGDVIGPADPIIDSTSMNSIYASIPVLFDSSFAVYEKTSPPIVLVWALPIYESEANFIKKQGWETFEDILESKDPDLWDLSRLSVLAR